jgi:hypothetical protein
LTLLSAHAQQKIDWQLLSNVSFSQPDPGHRGPVYGKPVFGESIKHLNGQTVVLHGYMLPLTADNQQYILSKYPFTECFFCGGAGKETVVELLLANKLHFDIDEPVTIQGTLHLVEDPLQLSYRLVDATQVE